MIKVDTRDMDRLARVLREYEKVSGKTRDDVLNRNGNNLRIQLWRLFSRQKWKGGKTVAWREFRARSKAGIGTKVTVKEPGRWGTPPEADKKGRKLSAWQRLIWAEIEKRRQGTGVLGVTFLLKRWRARKDEPRYLVSNKAGNRYAKMIIEKEPGYFEIKGFTPGSALIAGRYGILSRAIAAVRDNMMDYLKRKNREAWQRALKS